MGQRILFVMQYGDLIHPARDFFQNAGNTVFSSAGASFFWKQDVKYVLMQDILAELGRDPDWGRRNFDVAVIMEACLFGKWYVDDLKALDNAIRRLGIPSFVLGIGVESAGDYSDGFLSDIGDGVKSFCDAVLGGGGDMSLRGEFTKHCLERLGYGNLFVSGCPSLYAAGGRLEIPREKVSKRDFRPMLNGSSIEDISDCAFRQFKGSVFFAQHRYLEKMYHPTRDIPMTDRERRMFNQLYRQDRILGDMNYWMWVRQVRRGGFNFSYGSRIHGNIVALQQRIPAHVEIISARTREICDFYKIPNSVSVPFQKRRKRLYELYQACDYSAFNENYAEKYRRFVDFLKSRGLSHNVGESGAFFDYLDSLPYYDWLADEEIAKFKKSLAGESCIGGVWRRMLGALGRGSRAAVS